MYIDHTWSYSTTIANLQLTEYGRTLVADLALAFRATARALQARTESAPNVLESLLK